MRVSHLLDVGTDCTSFSDFEWFIKRLLFNIIARNDADRWAPNRVWCWKFHTNSSTKHFIKFKCVGVLSLLHYLIILCIMHVSTIHICMCHFLHHLRDFRREQLSPYNGGIDCKGLSSTFLKRICDGIRLMCFNVIKLPLSSSSLIL